MTAHQPRTTSGPGFVLVCGDQACGFVWEPSWPELSHGQEFCPQCSGWVFIVRLSEPGDD